MQEPRQRRLRDAPDVGCFHWRGRGRRGEPTAKCWSGAAGNPRGTSSSLQRRTELREPLQQGQETPPVLGDLLQDLQTAASEAMAGCCVRWFLPLCLQW